MQKWGIDLNIYAVPAALTLLLLVAETLFLIIALPETRNAGGKPGTDTSSSKPDKANFSKRDVATRIKLLKSLRKHHFLFLAIFSGVEFTLTFLTFDRKNLSFPRDLSHWSDSTLLPQFWIGIIRKMESSSDQLASLVRSFKVAMCDARCQRSEKG